MVSGEKRNCEEENALERITTILLDIEGTTTSINFVKNTLFPYVRENLKTYVDEHWNDEEFKNDLKALKLQAKKDEEEKVENFCPIEEGEEEKESVIKNILWQMDFDRKTTALKQLQGHIWREGYESGKLKGHIYGEVAQIFKKWSDDGYKLYIFSSGSVEAQKLLFKNSESGDLSGLLTGYFDTEIGPKTEASSYTNIIKALGCDAGQILFLTDVIKEAVAADKAGIQVMIVIREGNTPLSDDEKKAFTTVSSFEEIAFESSNKKKKICEDESVRNQTEKTENVEVMEESKDVKNGDTEKMETEPTDPKVENCAQENESEENCQIKVQSETTTERPETEPENIDVDVDDSAQGENSESEKIVSSSAEESEILASEVSEKSEKHSEEEKERKEISEGDENVDSTGENSAPDNDSAEKTEKPLDEEVKTADGEEAEKEEKNVNGHENGETKENNEEKPDEENNGEANGKVEEIEAMPMKKVNADEQADSTVEVTA